MAHDDDCDGILDERYELPLALLNDGRRLAFASYRCGKCGFQPMSMEPYAPAEKPCPQCGRSFLGMSDVSDELCDGCFGAHIDALFTETQADAQP
jgi:ribosomal protein S27AE